MSNIKKDYKLEMINTIRDNKLYVLSHNFYNYNLYRHDSIYEQGTVNFMCEFGFKENVNFLDIGANIGYHSVVWSILHPTSCIYAFEPHPEIFEVLKMNSELYKNIIPYNFAITKENSDNAILECSYTNIGGGSLVEKLDYSIPVKTKNIREFNINFDLIDCVKIDAQRYENIILFDIYDLLHEETVIIIENDFYTNDLANFIKDKNLEILMNADINVILRKRKCLI